jgi:hypothetical protein
VRNGTGLSSHSLFKEAAKASTLWVPDIRPGTLSRHFARRSSDIGDAALSSLDRARTEDSSDLTCRANRETVRPPRIRVPRSTRWRDHLGVGPIRVDRAVPEIYDPVPIARTKPQVSVVWTNIRHVHASAKPQVTKAHAFQAPTGREGRHGDGNLGLHSRRDDLPPKNDQPSIQVEVTLGCGAHPPASTRLKKLRHHAKRRTRSPDFHRTAWRS